MKQGIQTLMAEAGEAACYALCIIEIAERSSDYTIEPVNALCKGIDWKFIHYNERDASDNDNFLVKDPAAFLSMLTGKKWAVEKAGADYAARPGEYVVDRWERQATGKTIGHFRLPDWDSSAIPKPSSMVKLFPSAYSEKSDKLLVRSYE